MEFYDDFYDLYDAYGNWDDNVDDVMDFSFNNDDEYEDEEDYWYDADEADYYDNDEEEWNEDQSYDEFYNGNGEDSNGPGPSESDVDYGGRGPQVEDDGDDYGGSDEQQDALLSHQDGYGATVDEDQYWYVHQTRFPSPPRHKTIIPQLETNHGPTGQMNQSTHHEITTKQDACICDSSGFEQRLVRHKAYQNFWPDPISSSHNQGQFLESRRMSLDRGQNLRLQPQVSSSRSADSPSPTAGMFRHLFWKSRGRVLSSHIDPVGKSHGSSLSAESRNASVIRLPRMRSIDRDISHFAHTQPSPTVGFLAPPTL